MVRVLGVLVTLFPIYLPAFAEAVRILVGLPVPYVDDLQWFPGGKYLLVSRTVGTGTTLSVVLNVATGRWKPVQWVQNRNQLGKKPWTCIRAGACNLLIAADAKGTRVDDISTDPDCAWVHQGDPVYAPGPMLFDSADPANVAVSASGRYALIRLRTMGEEGYEFHGFWIIRLESRKPDLDDARRKAIAEGRRDPLIWELPRDRVVDAATWFYDPSGKLDRIAISHGDPKVEIWEESLRLLILEVMP